MSVNQGTAVEPHVRHGTHTDGRGIDLVIFDCDGVLVDSERLSVEVSLQVLTEFGLNVTRTEVIERFVGGTDGLIEATIEREIGRQLSEDECAAIRARYDEAFELQLAPVAGVPEMLGELRYRCCVASGSRPDSLRRKLELCGLLAYVRGGLFSAAQVAAGKPAPDLFLFAAAVMGVAHGRCIVVEDSVFGVQAARAAGMRVLAYCGGLITAEALAGPGTVLFDDMRQVPLLVSEMTER